MLGAAGWRSGECQRGAGTESDWSYLVKSGTFGWGVLLSSIAAVLGGRGWCQVRVVD
jgi:hypothetical protein